MKTQIARTLGVRQLYHYQPPNIDWLRQTVSENTVHCPSPQEFNDPWDCQPCWNGGVLDDPAERDKLITYLDGAFRKRFPGKPEAEYRQRIGQVRTDKNLLKSMHCQLSEIGPAIGEQYRIYCLSTQPDSNLMWSFYAEKHRGICLEFSTENKEFGGAYKVEYCDTYPRLDYVDNDDATVLLPLITKSAAWRHEGEFRVISEDADSALSADTLHARDKHLAIPDNALTSVVLGCLSATSVREEIRELISLSRRKIELREAVRTPNRYELSIRPYKPR